MKTNSCSLSVLLSFALAPLALAASGQRGPAVATPATPVGCTAGSQACKGAGPSDCAGTCTAVTSDSTPLVLGSAAQTGLLFQIDEERMARELYLAFAGKWALRPFENIPVAEARHEAVLRQLALRAGLTAPVAVAGRFASVEVQQRYDALLALGLESADSALRASAFVEEQDIADLQTLIASTDSAALKEAATALKTASGHHLNAFVGVLASRGITYAPKVLTAEEFKAMISEGGRGMGPGLGMSAGRGRGRS
ncbi:DUF2202 domain-containing protein [Horticoccus sp. 23ND18S-11]